MVINLIVKSKKTSKNTGNKHFLDVKSKTLSIKEQMNKLNFMKIKNSVLLKAQLGRKFLQSIYLIKDLHPKYIKNSPKSILR